MRVVWYVSRCLGCAIRVDGELPQQPTHRFALRVSHSPPSLFIIYKLLFYRTCLSQGHVTPSCKAIQLALNPRQLDGLAFSTKAPSTGCIDWMIKHHQADVSPSWIRRLDRPDKGRPFHSARSEEHLSFNSCCCRTLPRYGNSRSEAGLQS